MVRKVDCGSDATAVVWKDEKTFITGSDNGRIQQWSVDQDEASIDLKGHSGGVLSLDFHRSSALLASGSSDKTVIMHEVDSTSTPAPLHTLIGHKVGMGDPF